MIVVAIKLIMRPTTSDDDWLRPDATPSERTPTVTVFAGVFRIEAQGEEATRFRTLIAAAAEPPMTPEAEIRGAGGRLAECHPDCAKWVLTTLGKERVELEARGTDAETIIGVMLADDLRSCA